MTMDFTSLEGKLTEEDIQFIKDYAEKNQEQLSKELGEVDQHIEGLTENFYTISFTKVKNGIIKVEYIEV